MKMAGVHAPAIFVTEPPEGIEPPTFPQTMGMLYH